MRDIGSAYLDDRHFYAATNKNDLRDRLRAAVDSGLPVFVPEYGIRNTSDANLDGWAITLPFKEKFTISNSWNGAFSVNGTDLEIASVDYNRMVPADGTVSDIGFILSEK